MHAQFVALACRGTQADSTISRVYYDINEMSSVGHLVATKAIGRINTSSVGTGDAIEIRVNVSSSSAKTVSN